MPSFEVPNPDGNDITFDFEVYCDTCGAGLCGNSREVTTRTRRIPAIRVDVCPTCIKAKDDEIDDLKAKIAQLESEVEDLASRV